MLIEKFFEEISDIPDKNRGGCLFFCYSFWKYCKKNGAPLDTFDVFQWEAHHENGKISTNLEFLHCSGDDVDSSAHFAWTFEGKLYDGNGETTFEKTTWNNDTYENITRGNHEKLEEFFLLSLNADLWNPTFRRNSAINILKERLELDLEEVEDKFYTLY